MESLHIYKASAGSGKTYTLVQEYLRLILKSGDVYRFKRIMAMTFTNKAAFEMKERVIKALNQLVHPDHPDNKKFTLDIAEAFEMSPLELTQQAEKALSAILHNYSDLNIQTIDKFNVRLIRSFIRDLNMSNDFEVLVDTTEFNEKVVDKFLDSISSKEHQEEKNKLVINYLESKLEEEDKWGIREDLIDTLKYFEKETFRIALPDLMNYEFSMENLKQLHFHRERIEQEFEKEKSIILKPFVEAYPKEGFKELFLGINGQHNVQGRLVKLSGQDIASFEGFSESNLRTIQTFYDAQPSGLFYEKFSEVDAFVKHTISNLKDSFLAYNHAIASFYRLALLKYLLVQLNVQKLLENKIPINEINELISDQMRQEQADYIYERVGVRFDHFLLDEFQDTSRMQWLNLIPLVHNSMAQGHTNLIVGDSKQAIYRFRNGVVEQFADLPEIYNPENDLELARTSDYFQHNSSSRTLADNWRSRKDIIEFNNHLFSNLRMLLPESFQSYYHDADLIQNDKNQMRGWIYSEIELYGPGNRESTGSENFDSDDDSPEELAKDEQFLLQRVQDVLARGYQLGDICVLARENKDLAKWAKFLINNNLEVTTDEGLVVSNSARVKFVVAWMQLIFKPGSAQNQRDFALHFLLLKKERQQSSFLKYFKSKFFDFQGFVNEYFDGKQVQQMRYENLYDLVLKILRSQEIDELSDPFLHFFCNLVQGFDVANGPNLDKFLHFYNSRGKDKRVPLAEGNAIRLMTAHKSKGLEFSIVIIPNTKWDWKIRKSFHLYQDRERSLFYLASVSKNANATILQQTFGEEEFAKNKLDVLNLFYVACTRAVDELHLRVAYKTPGEKAQEPSHLAYHLKHYFEQHHANHVKEKQALLLYTFGEQTSPIKQKEIKALLDIHLFGETLWFPDISLIDSDSLEEVNLQKERILGRLIHAVLELMNQPNDLKEAINAQTKKYHIDEQMAIEIEQHIKSLLAKDEIIALIFPNTEEQTLDEREIIVSESERIRPDRVILSENATRVIDYKTGMPQKRDVKQIREYAQALNEMGYKKCKAYLIYTDELRVQEVALFSQD